MKDVVIEPRTGGRWFERDAKGGECDWGRVVTWQPPRRLVLAWHLQTDWTFNPDPTLASEVVLDFIAEGSATRIEFVHQHLEKHGENYDKLAKSISSPDGWPGILNLFVAAAK